MSVERKANVKFSLVKKRSSSNQQRERQNLTSDNILRLLLTVISVCKSQDLINKAISYQDRFTSIEITQVAKKIH